MISVIVPIDKKHARNLGRLLKYCQRAKVKGGSSTNQDQWFYALDKETAERLKKRAESLGFLPFVVNHYED